MASIRQTSGLAGKFRSGRRGALVVAAALVTAGSTLGCSTPENLGGAGAACLLFTDCDPHFVCYKNVCTDVLDGLVHTEVVDAASDYAAPEAAPGYSEGSAPYPEAAGETSYSMPEASAQPEAGRQPQMDASMQEASTGPEASATQPETSTSPVEAGE